MRHEVSHCSLLTRERDALHRLASGEVSEEFPASALWTHPDLTVLAQS